MSLLFFKIKDLLSFHIKVLVQLKVLSFAVIGIKFITFEICGQVGHTPLPSFISGTFGGNIVSFLGLGPLRTLSLK